MNRQKGFTLVEMVVALTILSLIVLATLTAVRTLGDTQARLQSTTTRLDEMRLLNRFLRDSLRQAMTVRLMETGAVYFEGVADEVRWVAPLQGVEGVAGSQYMRLYLDGETLKIQFLPFHPQSTAPDWGRAIVHPLVDNVSEFEVAYREAFEQPWVDGWRTNLYTGLPQAVRLRVRAGGRYWPDLVVAPDQYWPSQ